MKYKSPIKLTEEESDALDGILDSSGLSAFIKLLDGVCGGMERELVNFDISKGAGALLNQKVMTDGARKLYKTANTIIVEMRKSQHTDVL